MFKKLFKKVKDIAGDISPYSGLIASAFGLGPLYSTLIGAGVPLLAGKGGKEALAGGIGGYFGGKLDTFFRLISEVRLLEVKLLEILFLLWTF